MTNQSVPNKNIFKKYDIRGIYPEEIDEKTVSNVTVTLVNKVFKRGPVVIGHDARNSSPSLYNAAKESLKELEIEAIDIGMMTTPMLVFLINETKAQGGIMITASHNPKEYNGIKVTDSNGTPVSGEDIYKLL